MKKILLKSCTHLIFTAPIIFSSLLNAAGGFISMNWIGQLGQVELSSGALIYTVYSFYMTLAISFFIPVGIMIGKAAGEGDTQKISSIIYSSFLLAALIAIPCSLLMLNLFPVFVFFHQPPDIAQAASEYFYYLSPSVLPFFYLLILTQAAVGISKPRVTLWLVLLSLPIGLILTYGLIFGKFGLPSMGMKGAALASVITSWLSVLGLFVYLFIQPQPVFKIKKDAAGCIVSLFNMGWPIALQRGAEVLAFSVMTFMMGLLGGTALAAQQIILQYSMAVMMIAFSFSQAGGVLTGQAAGTGNFANAKQEAYISVGLGTFLAMSFALVFFCWPKMLIALFVDTSDPVYSSVVNIAVGLFRIGAIVLIFDSLRNIIIGVLRGFYDVQYPMMVGIITCWVIGIPFSYLFGFVFKQGAAGISGGFAIGIIISAMILFDRLRKK